MPRSVAPSLPLTTFTCAPVSPGRTPAEILGGEAPETQVDGSVAEMLSRHSVDVVVDYTCAEAVLGNVTLAVDAGVHAVVGSSGLTALDYAELNQRARGRGVGVIAAGNFSLLAALLPAACRLAGCDDGPNSATVCPSISQGTLSVCAQGTESTAPRRSTPC